MYRVQYSLYRGTLYTVHCTPYIIGIPYKLYIECTVYIVHSTVYSVQCTLYTVQCIKLLNFAYYRIISRSSRMARAKQKYPGWFELRGARAHTHVYMRMRTCTVLTCVVYDGLTARLVSG